MPDQGRLQRQLDELLAAREQEPGVAQAIATYEAVEQVYFRAIAATPPAVVATSYGTKTSPR